MTGRKGALAASRHRACAPDGAEPAAQSQAKPLVPSADALAGHLRQMADEDEYWDNDDLAATHRAIAATLGAQRATIAELLAALKPFADCCESIGESEDDEEWAKFRLLIGDYRRAAAAIARATGAA